MNPVSESMTAGESGTAVAEDQVPSRGLGAWQALYLPERAGDTELTVLADGASVDRAMALARTCENARFFLSATDADQKARVEALVQQEGLGNFEALAEPLGELGRNGRRYDLVLARGEFEEASAAARYLDELRSVMKSDGALHLSLPGRYGRCGIEMLQRLAGLIGMESEAEMRELLTAVARNAASNEAEREEIERWSENRQLMGELRRPPVVSFTVGEALSLLEDSSLYLQHLFPQAHYLARVSLLMATPELVNDVEALPAAEQYALMELYRGDIASHELIVCASESVRARREICFEGQDWLGYVPVRNPEVEVVADEGREDYCEARLRWARHSYPEITALLSAIQIVLLNCLDDQRDLRQVMEQAGLGEDEEAVSYVKNFFASLWRMDYVWFETPTAREVEAPDQLSSS